MHAARATHLPLGPPGAEAPLKSAASRRVNLVLQYRDAPISGQRRGHRTLMSFSPGVLQQDPISTARPPTAQTNLAIISLIAAHRLAAPLACLLPSYIVHALFSIFSRLLSFLLSEPFFCLGRSGLLWMANCSSPDILSSPAYSVQDEP